MSTVVTYPPIIDGHTDVLLDLLDSKRHPQRDFSNVVMLDTSIYLDFAKAASARHCLRVFCLRNGWRLGFLGRTCSRWSICLTRLSSVVAGK
jgi:hypothetical protein